jgi:Ni2+-binding GTPase involved in maturation of urease and hydrogenase
MRPLPVTIVSGAAGAGKTVLIDWAFAHRGQANIAVIACDAGKTLSARLIRIAHAQRHDHLFVEVAADQTLPADLGLLGEPVLIDNRVVVVDAAAWSARRDSPEADQLRQIRQADLLVINKGDLVTRLALAELEDVLGQHNPTAQMIRSAFGRLPTAMFLGAAGPPEVEPAAATPRISLRQWPVQLAKLLVAAIAVCLLLGTLAWQLGDAYRVTALAISTRSPPIRPAAPRSDLSWQRVGRRAPAAGSMPWRARIDISTIAESQPEAERPASHRSVPAIRDRGRRAPASRRWLGRSWKEIVDMAKRALGMRLIDTVHCLTHFTERP